MIRKSALGWAFVLVCGVAANIAQADWLSSQARPDGSYTTPNDLATPEQATAETVRTLRLLGRATEVIAADVFLQTQSYNGTEAVSRRIIAAAEAGTPNATLITELLTHQNADGGFGESTGYDSTPFDTALALEALARANAATPNVATAAVGYLLQKQNASGGWALVGGDPDVFATSLVARALHAYRAQFTTVAPAVAKAANFLLSSRSAGALWGEDFLSAQALLTVAATSSDVAAIQQSATALRGTQRADGSWAGEVYSTALALRALQVADGRGSGTGTSGGSIAGYVLRATTNEPLAGASVTLTAVTGLVTQTNADGYFSFSGVPVGDHTIVASKPGFVTASAVGTVRAGQLGNAGSILLVQSAQTAIVRGAVFDAASHQPLNGVTITLSGPSNYSVTTAADGSFELSGIEAANYSVSFSRNGYYSVSGSLSAPAGSLTAIQQGLTLQGAAQDGAPATLTGRVVDASTGNQLANAQVALNGGTPVTSASDGTFTFANVPRGNYVLQVSAGGYESRAYSFVFAPGANGALGAFELFPSTGGAAPTTLTIVGVVVDAVDNHALGGATVTVAQTGQVLTADGEGRFTLSGLAALSIDLTVTAANHAPRSFNATASGFGQLSGTFALPPVGGDDSATASTLRGSVVDSVSHQPIAGAQLKVGGTSLTAISGADGSFQIDGIQPLGFNFEASATRYVTRGYAMDLTQRGTYSINVELTPAPATSDRFQVVSFAPVEGASGANSVQRLAARVANLATDAQSPIILADVLDETGATIATVSPYAPGTTQPAAQIPFAAGEVIDLVLPWNTAQFPPGAYRVALRIVEPGTVTRDLPSGVVLAQSETHTTITATAAILGQLGFDPPLSQAGTTVPVSLTALVINSGNIPLTGAGFTLTITDPVSHQTVKTAQVSAAQIDPSNNVLLDFGSWVPTAIGDLPVTVRPNDSGTQGAISGVLYVGDKASGAFTVNKTVVPLGTQTVRASISMQGVDVRTGTSTDPLFVAVKEAVRKGGAFVGPQVRLWNQTSRCLGCHIQTQSFMGMAAAMDKADIPAADVQYLYNDLAGSLQSDGRIVPSHTEAPQTQTTLGVWSLSGWHDARQVFRTMYRASAYQLSRVNTSGNQSWWSWDHCMIWYCNNESQTMTSVKGLVATLQMASQLGSQPVNDYVFDDIGKDFVNRDILGMQKGPDGWIWYVDGPSGQLIARDMATNASRMIATGLGSPAIDLAITPDGTAWVTSPRGVTKIAPDGTKTNIQWSGIQSLWGIAVGPDGALYVSDTTRIWRLTTSGQATVFVSGGLLNSPVSLWFDSDGTLYTANYNGWNILQITQDGTVSAFADGLPFKPVWIRRAADGYLYALTERYNNSGIMPAGIFRIDAKGYVERLPLFDAPNRYGYNAMAVIDGDLYVNHGNNHRLYRLRITQQDTAQLTAMRDAVTRAARWTLATYNDNGQWNDLHAMRLITLAEARTQITDPTLLSQIDTAINNIANLLRARQKPNGGWTYTTGRTASDPYATAFVGLALEYTNPSVNDPVIRNSITYLLNTQLPDGSWPFQNGVFTTKLGPASFVMAYMPKALERLGGIDADLNVTIPASVQLSSPTLAPTAQSTAPDGSHSYKWSLQGVTASGRNVGFDLTLANMAYHEERPVASTAYLEFANSFSGEKLRADLDVPRVRAVSNLGLAVATSQPAYDANVDVPITSTVSNVGPPVSSGQVHVVIRASDGTVVADLGTAPFGALATGGSVSLPSTWNTGRLLAGPFQVYAQLYDQTGQLIDERTAEFSVVSPAATVTASITPDKPDYQAWDSVALANRVRNVTANAIQPPSTASLTVRTPGGTVLFSKQYSVNTLTPGAFVDLHATLPLSDAASGDYPAELVVKDAFSGALLATAHGSFHVTRDDAQALTGKVTVSSTRVEQGDSNLCTDSVSNLARTGLAGVTLIQSLINLDTQTVVETKNVNADFNPQEQQVLTRSVATRPLAVGGYACVLAATYNGQTRQLGSASFTVQQPAVHIDASLQVGARGRLLVLMDGAKGWPCAPIKDIELWSPFHTRLSDDATVDVELQDEDGQRVDAESVELSRYRGPVNRHGGRGADLVIAGISRDVLTIQVRGGAELRGGYRVVATARGSSLPAIIVDSGMMGEHCGWPVGVGARFGDFECSDVRLPFGRSLPAFRDSEPELQAQRSFLETLLRGAGWSYKIVTDAEAFERELRSGAYSQYAVFAEHERLDEHAQKELREAVFRGEGLLEASRGDRRQWGVDQALGIKRYGDDEHDGHDGDWGHDDHDDHDGHGGHDDRNGYDSYSRNGHRDDDNDGWHRWGGHHHDDHHHQPVQVTVFDPAVGTVGTAPLAFASDVERVKLFGAQAAGRFLGLPGPLDTAVTRYTYGRGKSVHVSYDLLAEATRAGSSSLHAALLKGALEHTKPSFAQLYASQVVPLHLTLTNRGNATSGRVTLPMPAGAVVIDQGMAQVSGNTLTWTFDLAKDQQLAFDVWVRLPAAAGNVSFDALVQSGTTGNYVDQSHARLDLQSDALASIADARASASHSAFVKVRFWLDKAQFWADRGKPLFALASLLEATDELIRCTHPLSAELRLKIDAAIWTVSRNL